MMNKTATSAPLAARLLTACCILLGPLLLPAPSLRAAEVGYQRDIKPILDRYCVDCHSGWFADGGLRLDSLDNILAGGKQGPAVIPGQPEKGWLVNLIRSPPGRFSRMPPGPARLSDQQVALIQAWIAAGAGR